MSLAGNLRDLALPELLRNCEAQGTSGVLRLRSTGPDGAQRGDLVLRGGRVAGAALYRAGGIHGGADALVESALCSPEDAMAAVQAASQRGDSEPHALRDGAARVGVSYAFVVETLTAHVREVVGVLRTWRTGTYELVLEGFPAGVLDRDSASARAFSLDDGLPAEEALHDPAIEEEPTPSKPLDIRSFPPPAPGPSREAEESEPTVFKESSVSGDEPTPVPSASGDDEPTPTPAGDAVTRETFAAPPVSASPSVAPTPWQAPPEDHGQDPGHAAGQDPGQDPGEEPAPWSASEHEPETAPAPAADAPTHESAPAPPESPWGADASAEWDEPSLESPVADGPVESVSTALAASAADGSSVSDVDDDAPDENLSPGVDYSAPGFGESALMEAEQLLDGEVLAVMLEMGNSAAAVAAEVAKEIRTGHIVLVDEDGQLAGLLAPGLLAAGYVVHPVRGREAAIGRLEEAAANGERPLVVCDLLLTRDGGGMLGGLDVAARAAALAGMPPVILLAETTSDEVTAGAEQAQVKAILERPLKSALRKDEAAKDELVATLLLAVDEHRPRAEWRVEGAGEWSTGESAGGGLEEGWDVEALERKAEEVDDLPDFGIGDPATRRDALWRETMRALAEPLSPPEILLQILRFGAEVLSRGVLFTPAKAKGDLKGFGQFGVELAPDVDPDDAVRKIRFHALEHPGVERAIHERMSVRWGPSDSAVETHLVESLGGRQPAETFLGPVFCQGKLAALLYGDMLPANENIPDTTNLEVVLGQAGLALDRHELESRLKALERNR